MQLLHRLHANLSLHERDTIPQARLCTAAVSVTILLGLGLGQQLLKVGLFREGAVQL